MVLSIINIIHASKYPPEDPIPGSQKWKKCISRLEHSEEDTTLEVAEIHETRSSRASRSSIFYTYLNSFGQKRR
ncbi:MAG: hypothetical protein BWY68_00119 [bacterium ADurb.Bin400]|nr:MAG: hypothetical protein BWY68_00119 [bacterium ADurb.Bin400]